MILRTKPYTVGCGIQLNPNGSSLRCGNQHESISNINSLSSTLGKPANSTYETALCENCKVRQQANNLMALQESNGKSS